jgi:protein-S-isoprenylcysteine O-methyltransferase Ste14
MLVKFFKREYVDYMKNTPQFIPWLPQFNITDYAD